VFEEILARLGTALKKSSLPYMVIGGQAVLLYGEPRLTRDIDITLGVNTDRLDELLGLIRELNLKLLPKDPPAFVKETMVLPCLDPPTGIRVDFIFSFTPYETEAISRAKAISIGGQQVFFASAEDVIIHKIFAGRPRDLEDARIIILKNKNLNWAYVENWLKNFDASVEGHNFLKIYNSIKERRNQ
jgi:Nucleotidyl transferase AbiEii toxin, Type IV TA system